jgi:hypothetical protein
VIAASAWCEERMRQIVPLTASRGVVLNWSERRALGPTFTERAAVSLTCLLRINSVRHRTRVPIVFVLRRFNKPRVYRFGNGRIRDDAALASLLDASACRPGRCVRASAAFQTVFLQ